jgi:hypothetical protein
LIINGEIGQAIAKTRNTDKKRTVHRLYQNRTLQSRNALQKFDLESDTTLAFPLAQGKLSQPTP